MLRELDFLLWDLHKTPSVIHIKGGRQPATVYQMVAFHNDHKLLFCSEFNGWDVLGGGQGPLREAIWGSAGWVFGWEGQWSLWLGN